MSELGRAIDRCRKALQFTPSRKRPGLALVHDPAKSGKGRAMYSKSPKATGVAGQFSLGKTGSGKEIHSYSHQKSTHSWGPKDHMDAYRAHASHVSHLNPEDTHPKLIEHHQAAMQHHWKQAFPDVKKSLDLMKSHPHSVLGRTRSGKKIYHHHHHHSHSKFTSDDHKDAAHLHAKRSFRIMERMKKTAGKKKHVKMHNALARLLNKHSMGAHVHGHSHHAKKGA